MTIDPDFAALIEMTSSRPRYRSMSAVQARTAATELGSILYRAEWKVDVRSIEDIEVAGAAGRIGCRIYRPESDQAVPTVVYAHGGGHVLGGLNSHDLVARRICRSVGAVVVSVDYRLAPEHPFPAGTDDCYAVSEWVFGHADFLGGDATSIGLAGDSSGANLAAASALRLRENGLRPKAQLLVYPELDTRLNSEYPSRTKFAEGYYLEIGEMEWFINQYLPNVVDRENPYASPILGDLRDLCPTVVVVAEFDPLRDEGLAFAAALQDAGNSVTLIDSPGMIHSFLSLAQLSSAAVDQVDRLMHAFAKLLR